MKNILLVDTNRDNLKELRASIETGIPDLRVYTACSGIEGVELARKIDFIVVLLDAFMPGLDGFKTCKMIKQEDRTGKISVILIVDKNCSSSVRARGLVYGADGFVSTPFVEKELMDRIRSLMKSQKAIFPLNPESPSIKSLPFLFNNIQDAVFLYESTDSVNYVLVDLNVAASALLGVDADVFSISDPLDFFARWQNNPEDMDYSVIETECFSVTWGPLPVEIRSSSFTMGSRRFILHLVRDITDRRSFEKGLQHNCDSIESSLDHSIDVISLTLEARNPWMQGHHRRVAELAVAIGEKMNVGRIRLKTIRRASMIHDIGYVSIPVDILKKDSDLSDLESELIRQHPLRGFEIASRMDLSESLAISIRQHHERMDGSGYPYGLKGDDILLESRIIAVAEVAVSMLSDRPYRSAMGADAVIEELTKNRGTLYDADVCDICCNIIKEEAS